jgi:hypothetical protein
MCGVRWIWSCGCRAVERCIGAKIQGREQRLQQKEMIVGSGTLLTQRTTRWERHGVNSSRCLFVALAPGVRCADLRSRKLRGWDAMSHTEWAAHQGYASCRKQR